jgi:hypothetical protein
MVVGRSPEPGRLALPALSAVAENGRGPVVSLGWPVSQKEKKSFCFSFIIWKENCFEKMLCTHFGSKNYETNFVMILMSISMAKNIAC